MKILTHKLACLAAFPPKVMGNYNSGQLLCDYVTGYITFFIIHQSFLPTEKKKYSEAQIQCLASMYKLDYLYHPCVWGLSTIFTVNIA